MHCTSSRSVVHSLYSLYGLASDTGKVCTGNSYSQKIKNYWKKKVISEPSNTQSNQINHIFFLSLCDRKNNNCGKRKGCTGNGFASNQSAMPGVNMSKSPPFPATRPAKHQCLATPMPIPAFVGPMRWRLHVVPLGCPQPSPMGQGPATTH